MKNNNTNNDAFIFALFDQWLQKCAKDGSAVENSKEYTKKTGYPYNSPIALMFSAFVGGLDKGLELGMKDTTK